MEEEYVTSYLTIYGSVLCYHVREILVHLVSKEDLVLLVNL